jgi:clusterin-associated protein 1
MADLLQWLTALYDPDIVVLPDLASEHGRVDFIRSIVQQMAVRSGIRMNPRKLYASDSFAVRELLKLAAPIYRGVMASQKIGKPGGPDTPTTAPSVQRISQLSASMPKRSVELFDLLENELTVRQFRTQVLSSLPPLDVVEKGVIGSVDGAVTRLQTLSKELETLKHNQETLKSKIAQRKNELDRQTKRLSGISAVRPAYMDEYEELEQELQELFKTHFQHYRNVDYLDYQIGQQEAKRRKVLATREKALQKMRNQVSRKLVASVMNSVGSTSAFGDDILLNLPVDNPGSDDGF